MKIFRITEILEWAEDERLIEGDASHEGWDEVGARVAQERLDKHRAWGVRPELPFECKAEDLDEAIEKLNERFFEYDYLKVRDVDYEIV